MLRVYSGLELVTIALGRAAIWVAIVLFGGALVLLAVDIALRYGVNRPMAYVSEVVTIAFIYVYLLGAAAIYARNEDLTLDIVFRRFGLRVRAAWLMIIYLAIAATMLVTLVETVQLMSIQRNVPTPLLRIPLIVQHGALAIAAAIILFAALVDAFGCWVWLRTGREPWRVRGEGGAH